MDNEKEIHMFFGNPKYSKDIHLQYRTTDIYASKLRISSNK